VNRGILRGDQTPTDRASHDHRPRQPDPHHLAEVFPREIAALFGPPPLLPDEEAATYRNILVHLSLTLVPEGLIDWLDLKEVGDLTFEILRWRRLRALRLAALQRAALERYLASKAEPRGMRPSSSRPPAIS
jgi:hypothetical protein